MLLDNDVLLKTSCYQANEELLRCLSPAGDISVLPVAGFVLASVIERSQNIIDKTAAAHALSQLLGAVSLIEPEENETVLAAEFKSEAQARSLPMDPGESLLFALLVSRQETLLITGDKRAIRSAETIMNALAKHDRVAGRIACMEQLILHILNFSNASDLHLKVCREPGIDKTLSICFSCSTGSISNETATVGLTSYISDLQKDATILLSSCDLSSVIS